MELTIHFPHHQDKLLLVLVVLGKLIITIKAEQKELLLHLVVFLQEVVLVVLLQVFRMVVKMVDLPHPQVHLVEEVVLV